MYSKSIYIYIHTYIYIYIHIYIYMHVIFTYNATEKLSFVTEIPTSNSLTLNHASKPQVLCSPHVQVPGTLAQERQLSSLAPAEGGAQVAVAARLVP